MKSVLSESLRERAERVPAFRPGRHQNSAGHWVRCVYCLNPLEREAHRPREHCARRKCRTEHQKGLRYLHALEEARHRRRLEEMGALQ